MAKGGILSRYMKQLFITFSLLTLLFGAKANNIDSLLNLVVETNNDSIKASLYLETMRLLSNQDNKRIKVIYKEALPVFKQNKEVHAAALLYMGWSLGGENIDLGKQYLEQCIQLTDNLNVKSNAEFFLGYLYLNVFDLAKAGHIFNKTIPFFESIENHASLSNVYLALGNLSKTQGEFKEAERFYFKSLMYGEQTQITDYISAPLISLSKYYLMTGRYTKALKFAQRNTGIGDANYILSNIEYELILGYLFIHLEDYDNAAIHTKNALQIATDAGLDLKIIEAKFLQKKLLIYKNEINNTDFLKELNQEITFEKNQYLYPELLLLNLKYFKQTDQRDSLLNCFETLKQFAIKHNLKGDLAKLDLIKATSLVEGKKYKEAIEILQHVIAYSKQCGNPLINYEANSILYNIYIILDEKKDALNIQNEIIMARDTMSLSKPGKLIALNVVNTLIESKKKIVKTKLKTKKAISFTQGLIVALVFSGISIILGLFYLFRSRKFALDLKETNDEIIDIIKITEKEKSRLAIKILENEEELRIRNIEQQKQNFTIKEFEQKISNLKSITPENMQDDINMLSNQLKNLDNAKQSWEMFQIEFEQSYPQFFNNLLRINPNLTQNDLKNSVCLFLNLSASETAKLLDTSVAAVLKTKQRLKKKLFLSKDQPLSTFIRQNCL